MIMRLYTVTPSPSVSVDPSGPPLADDPAVWIALVGGLFVALLFLALGVRSKGN
jgi:hypothetical protein